MAHILIIEDNAEHRDIFGRLLARAGHRTIGVAAGGAGLLHAQQQLPDLIMLDIRLPDTDGWAVARTLKSDARTQHIPVLILTAEPLARELLATPVFGCDAILLKPFNVDILLATVVRLLALQLSYPDVEPSTIALQRCIGIPPAPATDA